jgi:lysophospholipase L1-like esterase
MEPLAVQNFGCGWDRIENVLWRVYHDELDGYSAKQVLIKIGTNNLEMNSNEEIAVGLKFLVKAIQMRQPNAKVTMLAILPRRKMETRVEALNKLLKKEFKKINIPFVDAGAVFKLKTGKIDETLFTDGLHPNAEGYRRFGKILKPILEKNK